MITILANLRINSPEKLQHLKDGLPTFEKISDNWLINVRGIMREEALAYLIKKLGKKMIPFKLLNDKRGWLRNVSDMLKKAKYDYVLIWNEDHFNIASQRIYQGIVKEMREEDCDYLFASWWHFGKYRQSFDKQNLTPRKHIDSLLLTKNVWQNVVKAGHNYYLISMVGIFKKVFLKKLIVIDQGKLPIKLTFSFFKFAEILSKLRIGISGQQFFRLMNKIFFYRLRKYSDETPFEIEKDESRTDILPLKYAVPKQELFVCVDDDLGVDGYSLISRGLYNKDQPSQHESYLKNFKKISQEINYVLDKVDESQVENLINIILNANKIIVCGAGRVGMSTKAFGMRLAHLGLSAFFLGDATVPRLGKGDLLIACSGSGETQTIYDLVSIAKQNESKIALITTNPESRMGQLADVIMKLPAPSKTKTVAGLSSIQPMTTLFEQCAWLFFDTLVLLLMNKTKQTGEDMWRRHVNLE